MKACVTGFGMVDASGYTPKECYTSFIERRDCRTYRDISIPFNAVHAVDPEGLMLPHVRHPNLSHNAKMALHAVNQALEMAQVPDLTNGGVFFSSNMPVDLQSTFFEKYVSKARRLLTPRQTTNALPGFISALISQAYGAKGINTGITAACATGATTIDVAMRYLEDYDYVIVGSTDDSCHPAAVHLFNTLGVLSNRTKPFDKARDGFVIGEGAGCMILEHPDKARARGARIYATLQKPFSATDVDSETSPSAIGEGAIRTMEMAMRDCDVDVVCAHGTATPIGDEVEYQAIRSLTTKPIFSCKGSTGHTLNASGMIEIIYNILFGLHGHTGFNHNLTNPIHDDAGLIQTPLFFQRDITVLKNIFGFGGRCVSQVITIHHAV